MGSENLDKRAPDGYIYLCGACGKTSPTQSGWEKDVFVGQRGWDASCMLNCDLVPFVVPDPLRTESKQS